MPVIDGHVHLYPPEVNRDPAGWAAAVGERHWSVLCTRRRANGTAVQGFPALAELLRAMDAAGVERAVLLGWYWERPETCVGQNRFFADCIRRHPDRLTAFASVQPASGPEAVRELERAHADGLVGLGELSPHTQGVAPGDSTLAALFARAGELGMPVNLHVTDPVSRPYPGRVETPLADFRRWAQAHPQTRFVLAHWGGGLDLAGLGNVWVDTAAAPLVYGTEVWKRVEAVVPADRVLFGTDFPLNLYPRLQAEPEFARMLAEARTALPREWHAPVLGGNLEQLLNRP